MPDPSSQPVPSEESHASTAEARAALKQLTSADYVKLEITARFFCRHRPAGKVQTWEDVVNEAVVKTLDGRRRWRKSVTLLQHLRGVMKSDSSRVSRAQAAIPLPSEHITAATRSPHHTTPGLGPLDQIVDRESCEEVQRLFSGDAEAMRVLECRAEGKVGAEAWLALGMTKSQYDTVGKRILRKLKPLRESRG